MTITYLDLYNDMTGQAWSMFDGDVESIDEFEKSVTTSIQKALNNLWCSFDFPFREKTLTFKTKTGVAAYSTPNGNIVKKAVNGQQVHVVKIGNTFLEYEPDYETLEEASGQPDRFYLKNDKIYLYPTPDANYTVDIDYMTLYTAKAANGLSKATLENQTDYIDIPAKYEVLFKSALLPFAMTYAIASESDENYSGYMQQYKDAYKLLIKHTTGIKQDKIIGWK